MAKADTESEKMDNQQDHASEHEKEHEKEPEKVAETVEDAVAANDEAEAVDTADEGGAPESDQESETQIADLESEIAVLKDQLLRQKAETENVRRRADKDKADAGQYAVTSFAREMLSVGDNLSRALSSLPDEVGEDMKTVIEGVQMTERELMNIFERFGIKKISPEMGDKFDPQEHQAMFEVPTDEHPSGVVMQVVAEGYQIKDRLLRPAMVGVAKGSAPKVDTKA